MPNFAVSSHGPSFLVEALTAAARKFLADFGFSAKALVRFGDLRELRFAARDAGLSL